MCGRPATAIMHGLGSVKAAGHSAKPTEYRAYIARSDRQFDGLVSMFCVDDAEAIEKVKELVKGQSVEPWSGARLVIRPEQA
jgi:hypothetical protein